MSEYDVDVVCRAGMKHQAVHALSRLRTTKENQTYLDDDIPILATDDDENGKQRMHIIVLSGNEDFPIQATKGQPVDLQLTEKELVLEQKHEKYLQNASL